MNVTRQVQTRILIAMASILLLFACSKDSNEIPGIGSAEIGLETALATISRDNIQASLNYLAADEREGRMTGSRGYDESAQCVADQFAAIGLEPGGTDGWMQQIPFITRMIDVENSGVTLHKSTGDVDLEWEKDVIIYADKLRAENRIRAEVVFAGFGVHAPELGYSDFEGIDVSGKIVATFVAAPATFSSTERAHYSSGRTKAAELVRRGAIGEIGLMSRLEERLSPWEEYTRNLGTEPGMSWIDDGAEHSSLEGLTAAEAKKEGFELTPDPYPDEVCFIRSDQYSFVRQGIPAVYFAEGIGSSNPAVDGRAVQENFFNFHYHHPSDDLSQPIEWETALRFSRAGVRIGYRIAMEDQRPTWNEDDFFGQKFGH